MGERRSDERATKWDILKKNFTSYKCKADSRVKTVTNKETVKTKIPHMGDTESLDVCR